MQIGIDESGRNGLYLQIACLPPGRIFLEFLQQIFSRINIHNQAIAHRNCVVVTIATRHRFQLTGDEVSCRFRKTT